MKAGQDKADASAYLKHCLQHILYVKSLKDSPAAAASGAAAAEAAELAALYKDVSITPEQLSF